MAFGEGGDGGGSDAAVHGAEGDGAPASAATGATASAVAALLKALGPKWTWEFGQLQSWVMYSVTNSDLAVKIVSMGGCGAPQRAPQRDVFARVAKVLEAGFKVQVAGNTNILVYMDNWQEKGRKTCRVRFGKKVIIAVKCAVEIFHLIWDTNAKLNPAPGAVPAPAADLQLLEQYNPLLHPSRWKSAAELPEDFHTDAHGGRAELLSQYERGRWASALKEAKGHIVGGGPPAAGGSRGGVGGGGGGGTLRFGLDEMIPQIISDLLSDIADPELAVGGEKMKLECSKCGHRTGNGRLTWVPRAVRGGGDQGDATEHRGCSDGDRVPQ